MSEKGFLASISDFFKDLFTAENAATAAAAPTTSAEIADGNDDGLTGVERYIRNQASKSSEVTGVEAYIRNQASAPQVTGVETYIRNQANAQKMTGVEAYILKQA